MGSATRQSTAVDFVQEYAAAADRFAAAVAFSDMRSPVPTCPGWSTYDLVVHLGNIHAWAATIVETGLRAVEQNDEPRTSKPRVVSQWYAAKAEDLFQVLRDADPGAPCWNFAAGEGVTGFWRRRQLHETNIHLLDLDLAAGRPTDLAPEVSADGVAEVLTVFAHRMHERGHVARLDRPLALIANDTGDQWVVAPHPRPSSALVPEQPAGAPGEPETPPPSVGHRRSADVTVTDRVVAPADVLYRLLWKRLSVEDPAVRLVGDPDRVRGYLASRLVS